MYVAFWPCPVNALKTGNSTSLFKKFDGWQPLLFGFPLPGSDPSRPPAVTCAAQGPAFVSSQPKPPGMFCPAGPAHVVTSSSLKKIVSDAVGYVTLLPVSAFHWQYENVSGTVVAPVGAPHPAVAVAVTVDVAWPNIWANCIVRLVAPPLVSVRVSTLTFWLPRSGVIPVTAAAPSLAFPSANPFASAERAPAVH